VSSARTRRALSLLGVGTAVLAVAVVLGVGRSGPDRLEASPLTGGEAPAFTLPSLDPGSRPVRLSDLRGQLVVLNFWASWCAECHVEQEALAQTWDRFRDAGVVVVGVNFEDAVDDARAYVARTRTSYPVVVDSRSRTALDYGLRGVPETFLIDRTGHLVDRVVGPVTADGLADRIRPLLGGNAP
jgi:cytochrome c biogenesis protein CcmG, thiol:disulfide interchange protein DsbE